MAAGLVINPAPYMLANGTRHSTAVLSGCFSLGRSEVSQEEAAILAPGLFAVHAADGSSHTVNMSRTMWSPRLPAPLGGARRSASGR